MKYLLRLQHLQHLRPLLHDLPTFPDVVQLPIPEPVLDPIHVRPSSPSPTSPTQSPSPEPTPEPIPVRTTGTQSDPQDGTETGIARRALWKLTDDILLRYILLLILFRPFTQKEMERELKAVVALAGERIQNILPSYLFQVPQGGIIAKNFGLRDVFIWAPEKESSNAKPLCPACI